MICIHINSLPLCERAARSAAHQYGGINNMVASTSQTRGVRVSGTRRASLIWC